MEYTDIQQLSYPSSLPGETHRWLYGHDPRPGILIGKEWVIQEFPQVVRISGTDAKKYSHVPVRVLPKKTLSKFPWEYFQTHLVQPTQTVPQEEQILSILLSGQVRRGSLTIPRAYSAIFLQNIRQRIANKQPIQLVLPTLPFKDQNPLSTGHSVSWTDLGEYLCLLQMKRICDSIQQIYAHGAKITLLTDGLVYVHLFGKEDYEGARRYFQQIWHIKEKLQLSHQVEVVDMSWLVGAQPLFETVKDQIKELLPKIGRESDSVKHCLESLSHGMLFCLPSNHEVNEYISLVTNHQKLPKDIQEKISWISTEYASFLLAMKKLDVVGKAFPQAIRATVHCKDAPQIPLHLVNRDSWIFPYHGVPVVDTKRLATTKSLTKATRIMRLSDVYLYENVTEVYLHNEREPFYYEVA